jgi:hypothetical protein
MSMALKVYTSLRTVSQKKSSGASFQPIGDTKAAGMGGNAEAPPVQLLGGLMIIPS